MFDITEGKQINITRGDIGAFSLHVMDGNEHYVFQPGDLVRLTVTEKKNTANVVLKKDFPVAEEAESVDIYISGDDSAIGNLINKPTDYWYEIELNPDTEPQTIIGYDEDGPKVLRIYPEGGTL